MAERSESGKKIPRSKIRKECIPENYADDRAFVYKKICHGDPSRSLFFRDRPMPLCARCFGFYLFLVLSIPIFLLFYMIFDPGSVTVFFITLLLILPMGIDGYSQYLGWRRSSNLLRLITGGLGGMGSGAAFTYIVFRLIT